MLPVVGQNYQSRVDRGFPVVKVVEQKEVTAGGRVTGTLYKCNNGKWYTANELQPVSDDDIIWG